MAVEEKDIYNLDGDDEGEKSGAEAGEEDNLEDQVIYHHFYGF